MERQNITFEFAAINDYIRHLKGIAGPLKALLDKESSSRQDKIWNIVAKDVKVNYTNPNDGSVIMNNECICFVGTK